MVLIEQNSADSNPPTILLRPALANFQRSDRCVNNRDGPSITFDCSIQPGGTCLRCTTGSRLRACVLPFVSALHHALPELHQEAEEPCMCRRRRPVAALR